MSFAELCFPVTVVVSLYRPCPCRDSVVSTLWASLHNPYSLNTHTDTLLFLFSFTSLTSIACPYVQVLLPLRSYFLHYHRRMTSSFTLSPFPPTSPFQEWVETLCESELPSHHRWLNTMCFRTNWFIMTRVKLSYQRCRKLMQQN